MKAGMFKGNSDVYPDTLMCEFPVLTGQLGVIFPQLIVELKPQSKFRPPSFC